MKFYLLLASTLIPFIGKAQPVLTNMLNYTIGTVIDERNCNSAGIQPGIAGPGVTWNFSNLPGTDTLTSKIMNPASTPNGSMFPLATYAIKSEDGSYSYIKRNYFTSSTVSVILGVADSTSGMTFSYSDPITLSSVPFTYGDSLTDNYIMSMPNASGAGDVIIKADGYGTLQLPNFTYSNVLRIKSVYHEMDTIYAGPAYITTDIKGLKYEWYDNLHFSPLMTWDSTSIVTTAGNSTQKSVTYFINEKVLGIDDLSENISFSANLNGDQLNIFGELRTDKKYKLQLFGLDGRLLHESLLKATGKHTQTKISQVFPPGIYILKIQDNGGAAGIVRVLNCSR
jgi:hypothetical protein